MLNKFLNQIGVGIKSTSIVFLLLLIFTSCNNSEDFKEGTTPEQIELIKRGKAIYFTYCTVCHNPDPKLEGSIGPDLAGSSLELVRLRVLYLKYPEGYKPKRDTEEMAAFEDLEADIPAIHAFLNK